MLKAMAMFSWVCLFVHGKQGKIDVVAEFSARILPELSLIMQNCSILVIMGLNVFGV
jgi:hypothetical protein